MADNVQLVGAAGPPLNNPLASLNVAVPGGGGGAPAKVSVKVQVVIVLAFTTIFSILAPARVPAEAPFGNLQFAEVKVHPAGFWFSEML